MKESHEIKAQVDSFEKLVKSHCKILFNQSFILTRYIKEL